MGVKEEAKPTGEALPPVDQGQSSVAERYGGGVVKGTALKKATLTVL